MDIQSIIIGVILILCIVFVGIHIYRILSGKGKSAYDSCAGCALKNACEKKS